MLTRSLAGTAKRWVAADTAYVIARGGVAQMQRQMQWQSQWLRQQRTWFSVDTTTQIGNDEDGFAKRGGFSVVYSFSIRNYVEMQVEEFVSMYDIHPSALIDDALHGLEVVCMDHGIHQTELSLTFCTQDFIHALNMEHLGNDYPTDVLSFPMGDETNELLGDIVISLDAMKEQALSLRHGIRQEYRILYIHGLLHLLGYDHESSPLERQRMESMEKAVLEKLNWAMPGLIQRSSSSSSQLPKSPKA